MAEIDEIVTATSSGVEPMDEEPSQSSDVPSFDNISASDESQESAEQGRELSNSSDADRVDVEQSNESCSTQSGDPPTSPRLLDQCQAEQPPDQSDNPTVGSPSGQLCGQGDNLHSDQVPDQSDKPLASRSVAPMSDQSPSQSEEEPPASQLSKQQSDQAPDQSDEQLFTQRDKTQSEKQAADQSEELPTESHMQVDNHAPGSSHEGLHVESDKQLADQTPDQSDKQPTAETTKQTADQAGIEHVDQSAAAQLEKQPADNSDKKVSDKSKQLEEQSDKVDSAAVEKQDDELKMYWKAIKDNPSDFTGWTYLLQYVEHDTKIIPAREAFAAFLKRYPYCYGYWKKYADVEKRHDNPTEAKEVFERGVTAIPLSIDLWVHYIDYMIYSSKGQEDSEYLVRTLFQRAIQAAGLDFRSDKLWDKYINWEKSIKHLVNVTEVYDQILKTPTQLYSHHFESFCEHVRKSHPKDILSLNEFLTLRKEVTKPVGEALASAEGVDSTTDSQPGEGAPGSSALSPVQVVAGPPGIELPPGEESSEELGGSASDLGDEEVPKLKELIIEKRRKVHKETENEVSTRWRFEEAIRRPYFHVKPLERAQLRTWRDYLDFEMSHGSQARAMFLFERCLIACALYEEFWVKYAMYMEMHEPSAVRKIFERACTTHLPNKASLHLAWAAFEEKSGEYDKAESVLVNIEKSNPGLAMVTLRHINLHRRRGNFDEVKHIYVKNIGESVSSTCRAFYAIKYSRFLSKILNEYDEARKVLDQALEKDSSNTRLLLQLLDLEYSRPHLSEERLLQVFSYCQKEYLPVQVRLSFSQRKLEILEEFGADVNSLTSAYEQHQKLLKEFQIKTKRKAEAGDSSSNASESKKAKKARVEPISSSGSTSTVPPAPTMTNGSTTQAQPDTSSYSAYYNSYAAYQPYGSYNYNWGGYSGYY